MVVAGDGGDDDEVTVEGGGGPVEDKRGLDDQGVCHGAASSSSLEVTSSMLQPICEGLVDRDRSTSRE